MVPMNVCPSMNVCEFLKWTTFTENAISVFLNYILTYKLLKKQLKKRERIKKILVVVL